MIGVVCEVFDEFRESPQNKTVEFGDIAEFVCRVSDCTSIIQLLINGNIDIENNRLVNLDQREYGFNISCVRTESGGEHVAKFWMFVNRRTVQTVQYVRCKLISVVPVLSDRAYIALLQIPDITTMSDYNNTQMCAAIKETFSRAQTVLSTPLWLSVTLFAFYTMLLFGQL